VQVGKQVYIPGCGSGFGFCRGNNYFYIDMIVVFAHQWFND